MERIIHPIMDEDGVTEIGVAVLICHREDGQPLSPLPLTEVARKDVPAGLPYRIVDAADVPEDRTQRDLWTADFSSPDGFGLGHEAWFAEQAAAEETAE